MQEIMLRKCADIGPCTDVTGYNGVLYAIQGDDQYPGGRLCALAPDMQLLCSYAGLGRARQIEIADGIAVISAREDGLWLFDVRGGGIRLLSHYQTIEYATGVALYAGLAFVSCRSFGVEIVDIRNPERPAHRGLIRVGEAQSACVYENVLYCGIWGEMKVKAVDISDLNKPALIAEIPLQGRGDGVVARDGRLYAATGQHGRGVRNVRDESDPLYGMGNGVEVFDVSNPLSPVRADRCFFGKAYCKAIDYWDPVLCGDVLACCDSVLGVFISDTSRPAEPLVHLTLPEAADGRQDAATGIASCAGKLFVASAYAGLYVYDGMEFPDAYRHEKEFTIPVNGAEFSCGTTGAYRLERRYAAGAPVQGAAESGGYLALACGMGGLHIVDPERFDLVAQTETPGFCCGICCEGEHILAAVGQKGLIVYRFDGRQLHMISQTSFGKPVLQLSLSKSGNFLLMGCGSTELRLVDVTDRTKPREICCRRSKRGPLYGDNLMPHLMDDGTMLCFWHRDGLIMVNPERGEREFTEIFYERSSLFASFSSYDGCDTDGKNLYYGMNGGYVRLPLEKGVDLDGLSVCGTDEKWRGKIAVFGDAMVLTDRGEGAITVLDISARERPRLQGMIRTSASCGIPVQVGGRILIPGWHGGLLELVRR